MPKLPPIGAEIPISMLAINSTIEYKGRTINCDLRGGMKHRVDADPNDPKNSVLLRTIGFKVTAEYDEGLTITIEQNDVDFDPQSFLRQTREFPPQYLHHDVQSYTFVMQRDSAEPLILTTTDPMVCEATLTRFPPQGDQYKLTKPVDLVDPENPDKVVARLTSFSSKRGGL